MIKDKNNKAVTISPPKEFSDPKYAGKHVILAQGKIFTATPSKISHLWDEVRKKYPKAKLQYGFVPKGTWIL